MPRSGSRAIVGNDVLASAGSPRREPRARSPALFIVASPRPQVGKTFLARLLIDFLRLEGGSPLGFDLNPNGDALRDYLPGLATASDIGHIKGEMALFDRLIVEDGTAKVVDIGAAAFERFFAIAQAIRFFQEAARLLLEPIVLFAADPHPVAIRAYADLQRRFPAAILVPVFNAATSKGSRLHEEFPFTRAAAVPLQIPALAPLLRSQIENSACSFADVHDRVPAAIPIGLAFELRSWTRRTFLEFRELELRLLLEQLRASLPVVAH